MLHRIAFVAVIGIGVVSISSAQQTVLTSRNVAQERLAQTDNAGVAAEWAQEDETAARLILEQPIREVRFDDTRFADAVGRLRQLSGMSIFVNWKSLEGAGVSRGSPVSLHLRERKLSTVLDLMLAIVGSERAKLAYTIDSGVITISTRDDLSKNVVVRVYDIRDLLFPQAQRDLQVARITRLIEHQVDASSWKSAGGSVGALRKLEGQLIVTQTPENHRRIVAMLQDMRSK